MLGRNAPDLVFSAAPLATALRIDLRRPAGWIALAAAAGAGWEMAVAQRPVSVAAAVAAGSLLAVAAIGSPPADVPRGRRDLGAVLGRMRVGWPVLGFVVTGRVMAAAFAVATAFLVVRLLGKLASRPGATSLGLAIAGAAAAAALIVAAVGGGAAAQRLAAIAVWGLVAAGTMLDPALGPWESQAAGPMAARHRWPEAGHGLAMATALTSMVACFFLVPGLSWAYAALAVGWFVCLAVPAALDADPRIAAQRLLRAAAGRPRAPGTVARGLRTCAALAAILGWPALVAAALPAAEGGRVGSPLTAIAALALAWGVVFGATVVAAAVDGRTDTPRALVFSLAALAAVGATGLEGIAKHPVLPSLPGSPGRGGHATGVEHSGASCETPRPTQLLVSCPSLQAGRDSR